jgi:hypothetical protein
MATEEPKPTTYESRRVWFLRPGPLAAVGWGGFLVTTAGLLYAVYWRDHPELTCAVGATRARIVVAGHTSALLVFHGETAISTDVTAAQIALWNGQTGGRKRGRASSIRLLTEPRVDILEARWR